MFLAKSGVCAFPDDPSKYEKVLEDHKAKQKIVRKQLMVIFYCFFLPFFGFFILIYFSFINLGSFTSNTTRSPRRIFKDATVEVC